MAFRFAPGSSSENLGLLADLSGTWMGTGFNLIARPGFKHSTELYLQLNQTQEYLQFTPIGSPIPNRGFGQEDIFLQGLTYLQQISDAGGGRHMHAASALHIEPGIWVVQPNTDFPPDNAPPNAQLIGRMSTIPHGNALLAQGIAEPFVGTPVLTPPGPGGGYAFSKFPSFNSTPFGVPPTAPDIVINAAGSSERLTAPNVVPPVTPFPQYDLTVPIGPIAAGPFNPPFGLNTRTPYDTNPPEAPLPSHIDGVAMQAIINDPISLLQKHVQDLVDEGCTFEGTVLNVATASTIQFLTNQDSGPAGPITTVAVPQFGGGVENIRFLNGNTVPPPPQENAQTALVYATFWIEKVTHKGSGRSFMQLQYAQMVVLNFPVLHFAIQTPATYANIGWPHISVATLRKTFG